MTFPSIFDLRNSLSSGDWLWAPQFKVTHLGAREIIEKVSEYYFAVDKCISKIETDLKTGIMSNKHRNSPEREAWDLNKIACRDALMTYTHAGMSKPVAVHLRELLGYRHKWANLWYFAMAWQFNEWYEHIIDTYESQIDENSNVQSIKMFTASETLFEQAISNYSKTEASQTIMPIPFDRADESEQECRHKGLLLEVWLLMHGMPLNFSEKNDILEMTINRFQMA